MWRGELAEMEGYFVKVSEIKGEENKENVQAEKFRVKEHIECQGLSFNKLWT